MRVRFLLILVLVGVISLLAGPFVSHGKEKIVIGGKNFTEQYILPELAKDLLEEHGLRAELKTGVGSAVVRQSLLNDQIDLYYEYTGTAYTVYYKQSDRDIMTEPHKVYEWVKRADGQKGLIWLKPVEFNNTYTLMMRKDQAERLTIKTISQLSQYMNEHPDKLVIGVNAEFWERPDGFKPLMKTYGFEVPYDKIRKMESGLVYKALKDGNVDVSMGFATDGRIAAFGFVNLKDDKSFFPVYNPVPVVREEVLKAHPAIRKILQPIADNLTTGEMQELNAEVDVEHRDAGVVAREWLRKKGLL